MALIGPLWRRAPAWRACLVTAVAATAMTAMFPPSPAPFYRVIHRLTGAPSAAMHATPGTAPPAPVHTARYAPQPDAPVPDYTLVSRPQLGAGRSGTIMMAGRLLPLPPGQWQELVQASTGGPEQDQILVLGRLENGRLTGLVMAAAPARLTGASGRLDLPDLCFIHPSIAASIVTSSAGQTDPHAHECWTLNETAMTGDAGRKTKDAILRAGFERLDQLGDTVPESMLALHYFRSDQTGWLADTVFLPARRAGSAKPGYKPQAWAKDFAQALHDGYDGRQPSGIGVSRDPG